MAADRAHREEEKEGTGMIGSRDTAKDDALRDALRSAPPRIVLGEAASASAAGGPGAPSERDGEGPSKRGRIHEPGFPHNLQKMETKGKGDCGYRAIGMQYRMLQAAKAGGAMPTDTDEWNNDTFCSGLARTTKARIRKWISLNEDVFERNWRRAGKEELDGEKKPE